jgi:GNAT superfamily N-acetyltransferase
MIVDCVEADFDDMLAVINEGAAAYRGIIPPDRWHEPYMGCDELRGEISAGIAFRGWFDVAEGLVGVMGAQPVSDVLLIRHAYVKTKWQRQGVGSALIQDLLARAAQPVLVGTWAAAAWAIGFYQKHGFDLVAEAEKDRLLRLYWHIPDRQIKTSVVLVKDGLGMR